MDKPKILDTNVLINASQNQTRTPQTTPACKLTCLNLLMRAMVFDYRMVIDGGQETSGSEILAEYERNVQRGDFGELFLRWLLQYWQQHIRVPITPQADSYEEFPVDQRLKGFDLADHKWIAAAVACARYEDIQPEVIESADDKWRAYVDAFAAHDVNIVFICDDPASKNAAHQTR